MSYGLLLITFICALVVESVFFVYYLHFVWSSPERSAFDLSHANHCRQIHFINAISQACSPKIVLDSNVVLRRSDQLNERARANRKPDGKQIQSIFVCEFFLWFSSSTNAECYKARTQFAPHSSDACVCARSFCIELCVFSGAFSRFRNNIYFFFLISRATWWTGRRSFNCVWPVWVCAVWL